MSDRQLTLDDYLISAWLQMSPGHAEEKRKLGYPKGFWPEVARLAFEQAMAQRTQEELYALETEAKLRYEADHVWAAHSDEYILEQYNQRRSAQLKKKSKSENAADILSDIEDLF